MNARNNTVKDWGLARRPGTKQTGHTSRKKKKKKKKKKRKKKMNRPTCTPTINCKKENLGISPRGLDVKASKRPLQRGAATKRGEGSDKSIDDGTNVDHGGVWGGNNVKSTGGRGKASVGGQKGPTRPGVWRGSRTGCNSSNKNIGCRKGQKKKWAWATGRGEEKKK